MVNKINDIKFIIGYLGVVLVYCLVVGLQGFDMCDEGWVMTGCQQFFNDADSIEYQFLYYNTLLIGGLWYKSFGWMGYYGFRILASLVITATVGINYYMLKDIVNKWCIVLGTVICFCCWSFGIFAFHHNYLTMFLVSLSCLLIYKALIKDKWQLMLMGGIIVGVNTFSRLPNLTMIALILAAVPCIKNKNIVKLLNSAIVGFVIGVVSMLGVMLLLGHLENFGNAIDMMRVASNDPLSTHDVKIMFHAYALNYISIVKSSIIVFSIPIIAILICRYLNNKYLKVGTLFLLGLLEVYLAFRTGVLWAFYGFATMVCFYTLLKNRKDKQVAVLSLLSLVWLYMLPIGSDFGIGNMGSSCVWLAFPLAIGVLYNNVNSTFPRYRNILKIFGGLIFIAVSSKFLYTLSLSCYFDNGSRFEKVHRIDNSLATVYTTQQNKDMLDPLLKELKKYVKPNDYLLQYMKCPTIHYLTETRPYLGNSWVWSYTPQLIVDQFSKRESIITALPVIVREKSAISTWYEYDNTWNNDHADNTYEHKNEKITAINKFIDKHNYKVVWENNIFQILLP